MLVELDRSDVMNLLNGTHITHDMYCDTNIKEFGNYHGGGFGSEEWRWDSRKIDKMNDSELFGLYTFVKEETKAQRIKYEERWGKK